MKSIQSAKYRGAVDAYRDGIQLWAANLNLDADQLPEMAVIRGRELRLALSRAIDRDLLNEVVNADAVKDLSGLGFRTVDLVEEVNDAGYANIKYINESSVNI